MIYNLIKQLHDHIMLNTLYLFSKHYVPFPYKPNMNLNKIKQTFQMKSQIKIVNDSPAIPDFSFNNSEISC